MFFKNCFSHAALFFNNFKRTSHNKGDDLGKLGEQKSKLTKQLKCLNEDYNKYTADSSKQSDFEVMKKLLER